MRWIKFFITGLLLISCQKDNIVRDTVIINNVIVSVYVSGPDMTYAHKICYLIDNKSDKEIETIEISFTIYDKEPVYYDTVTFSNIAPGKIMLYNSELIYFNGGVDIRNVNIK